MKQLTFQHCWTKESIRRYFTTEAMSKEREAFLEVHLPIDEILVDQAYNAFSTLGGKSSIGEEDLLRLVIDSHPSQPNRIFLIVGQTGSGKSELCQWLSYRIDDQVHVPILIARSMTQLREIVAEINRHLGEPVPDGIKEFAHLWQETISKSLVAAMYRRLERPEVRNQIGEKDIERLRAFLDDKPFEELMRDNFVNYQDELKRLDKPRELNLLPEKEFRDLIMKSKAGGLSNPSVCYGTLQQAMSDCLANELQVPDLIEQLSRIAERYLQQGQRPVLLIEDITTFSFLQNSLLDYLFDLSSGHYDVVIGVTTGFEDANQEQIYKTQQTITERLEGRFMLTDEHDEAVFLRQHFVDLARLYLKAVKAYVPVPCPNLYEYEQSFGEQLYPFNRSFLTNVYKNLQQEGNPKQTPRLFLRALEHSLTTETKPPFESVEVLSYVKPPPTYFQRISQLTPHTERLFKWYGINTRAGVFLPTAVVEAFGLYPLEGLKQIDVYYHLPLRAGVEGILPPPGDLIDTLVEETPSDFKETEREHEILEIPQRDVEESKVEKKLQQNASVEAARLIEDRSVDILGELDQWLRKSGNFPHRDTLKDGVLSLLDFFEFAPFNLQHPYSVARQGCALVFRWGNKKSSIYLHHSADTQRSGYFKLTIEPLEEQSELFSQVLSIGLGNYEVEDSKKLDHVHLHDWLSDSVSGLKGEMILSLRSALGMQFEQFVILSKFLLLNNCQGLTHLDPNKLAQPIDGTPLCLPIFKQHIERLYECRTHIQALFVAFFHLRDNLVDYPLLRRTTKSIDVLNALKALERLSPDEVAKGFQITVSGDALNLQHIVKLVRDYAGSLRSIQKRGRFHPNPTPDELERVRQLCDPPDKLASDKLRQRLNHLRNLARKLELPWQRQWDYETDDLNSTSLDFVRFFERLTVALSEIRSLQVDSTIFTYLAIQRQVNFITSSDYPEYGVLRGLDGLLRGIDKAIQGRGGSPELSSKFRNFDQAFQKCHRRLP